MAFGNSKTVLRRALAQPSLYYNFKLAETYVCMGAYRWTSLSSPATMGGRQPFAPYHITRVSLVICGESEKVWTEGNSVAVLMVRPSMSNVQ